MKDKNASDGAHEAMLKTEGAKPKIAAKETAKAEEYEALQSFLRSISSTATLPPYVKGETYSSVRGVFNQCLITCAVLILAAGAGHPIGFSAVALPQLRNENSSLRIDNEMGSWIASIHSAATPLGSMMSGPVMEAIGRRRTLQASTLPLVLGWILIGTATHHALVLLGRVVCGFAVGIMAAPSQVYIGEISEPRLRGLLIGTPFVAYSVGVLYVYALGGVLPWRHVAFLCIVLPTLAVTALCFAPESPTWLARRGRFHEAMAAMSRLRGDPDTAQRELHELINAREKEKARGETNIKFFATVFRMPVLKPLLLINAFNMLQIVSGSYVVIFYAVDIVKKTGGSLDPQFVANASAVVRLGVTVIACILLLKITRRCLVMISGVGTAASTLALCFILAQGSSQISTDGLVLPILILSYVAFNTLGFFLLPGLMIGELLPTKIRGLCGGYIFCLFNAVLFGFTKLYPVMENNMGMAGVFGLFGASAALATIVLFLLLPETKDKSLLQIEQYYQKPNILWVTRKKMMTDSQTV
ncbi:facilitated trehalose transporter Tret1-like isoform X2 [Pectinophora gossypiella]|uniref:facilitated trehalose transporter Tret1-like isoform X2 n=1 Tax=Pectinophora gossypiella TaxID=13191 RepID=UPI00214E30C6|nr:facilitated trehalose transporter Tret1-like isoform X2 [Pectinophora gossypiella]